MHYLVKNKTLLPCELVQSTPHWRQVSISIDSQNTNTVDTLESQNKATVKVHPQGVAWPGIYPRLFESTRVPRGVFTFKNRAMLIMDPLHPELIEPVDAHYRFQPFLRDVIDSIHARENVILTGGTGVGKTTHIAQLAARIGQPLLRINFNGETRMSDLIGKVQVIGGQTVWVDGILPQAMRLGYWLLLDELDFADPAVLSLLHPVLEESPVLVLKENGGEVIRPHVDFRLFATANSIGSMQDRAGAYTGTNQMNEAFLDRWQILTVDPLPAKEEVRILRSKVPSLRASWAKHIVEFANKARARTIEFSADNFSTRKTLKWASKTALHRCPIEGAKLSWMGAVESGSQEGMMRLLNTQFGASRRTQRGSSKPKTGSKTASRALGGFGVSTRSKGRKVVV